MKKWFIAAGLVAIGTLALFQSRASATPQCKRVRLTLQATLDPEGCDSPVGMCTTGTLYRGNSPWATTHYVATSLGSAAVTSDMSYAGIFTITRPNGVLTVRDSGMLGLGDALYSEYQRVVSGTGVFAGATGTMFSSGNITGDLQGFDGTLTGELCLADKHGNHHHDNDLDDDD